MQTKSRYIAEHSTEKKSRTLQQKWTMEISKTVKIKTRTYNFSVKDLKLLEIIANHMREEQGYYLQQMERYHINFHDLKRVAHIGPELYERFLYSIVSEHKLKVIHMAIQLILREVDLSEKENMHPRGHREKEFLDSYRDFLFSKSIAEMDDYIESINQKYQIIQNSNFVSIINELIQCKAIHLNINYLPKHK